MQYKYYQIIYKKDNYYKIISKYDYYIITYQGINYKVREYLPGA